MELIFYNGEHSATIGEMDTWEDWHLIPSAKIVISPPPVKTKKVEVNGVNGTIDLTSILANRPNLGNRTGSIEFILAPGFLSWENAFSEITNYIHGRTLQLVLADEPGYYYVGQFSVNSYKSDSKLNSIVIDYNLYPTRYEIEQL